MSKWSKSTLNLLKKTFVQIPSALASKSLGCTRSISNFKSLAGFPLLSSHVQKQESLIPTSSPFILPSRYQIHVSDKRPICNLLTLSEGCRSRGSWIRECMTEEIMEALTTAFKLWTSIEKVQSDQWTGSLDFTLNSFRQTCKTTNSATESPRSKCSVCQGSRAPTSCEEAQEAQQRQQEMCCCQTLQREGAHCLCAWHWPQPSGFQHGLSV